MKKISQEKKIEELEKRIKELETKQGIQYYPVYIPYQQPTLPQPSPYNPYNYPGTWCGTANLTPSIGTWTNGSGQVGSIQ